MSTASPAPTTSTALAVEKLVLNISEEIKVHAPIEVTFEAVLEQLGPGAVGEKNQPMPMKLEAWPGGRLYRDLGDGNGHFWGNVQAIKRPTLLEISGPLFMSFAVANNVQYRLKEVEGGTLIEFHHYAFGLIPDDYRANINTGWAHINGAIRARAEKK